MNHQLTLGELIDKVKALHPTTEVPSISMPHAHQCAMSELAFEEGGGAMQAQVLLRRLERLVGERLMSSPHGSDVIARDMRVWIAGYAEEGLPLLDFGEFPLLKLGPSQLRPWTTKLHHV